MILVVLFMGIYYIMSAPSQRTIVQEAEYAIEQSDLRSVAECTAAVHNATIKGYEFNDICVDDNGIQTNKICLNNKMEETPCDATGKKKLLSSFFVTATAPLTYDVYNNIMTIMEKHYTDAGVFGLFINGSIITGGDSLRHGVPQSIISAMDLQDGALVYMTQYDITEEDAQFTTPITEDVICPAGTSKTYRFGRWQCIPYNVKTTCSGDMIWDNTVMACVPDETRKPLCETMQNAIIVDDMWECVDPYPDRECPGDLIARLNYQTFEWECISDPTKQQDTKKCDNIINPAVRGRIGTTLRVPQTSCTDCEKLIVDPDTCYAYCVPDESKMTDSACYSGNCTGASKGFYFGFPNTQYLNNMDISITVPVSIDANHSQNRRFNCMDCTNRGGINNELSMPPYVTVCNEN